ncbi:MAG: DNA polymerase III subunit alpha [Planctomycetes bacterium]|nr:DNA polymerase III subunit alpha [Planctomycetota bacterium]
MFAHLHVHSNFSFHDGTMHPHEVAERAAEAGYKAVALTDTNGTYAAVTFYEAVRERGLVPILGAEVDDPRTGERAVVLARDRSGYATLNRLATARQLEADFALPPTLAALPHDVVLISRSPSLLSALGPREGLYAELVHTGSEESRREATRIHALAGRLGLPVVATGAVRLARPEDHGLHRLLRAIGDLTTWSRVEAGRVAEPEQYLKAPEAMRRLYRGVPEAIGNAERIAEECRCELELGRWKFPRFPLPEFETAESWLQRMAKAGFEKRYPDPSPEAVRRFAYELSTINTMGFASYFLVVWDIARRVRTMGIPCLGRGSAGCSLIAYCLEITHTDPIRYDLYFERFLNPSRLSPPDIDLDLSWAARDRVLADVYELYGARHVAMISTTNRYGCRSAFREAAKAMGLPESEVNRITRRFPWAGAEALERLSDFVECRDLPLDGETFRSILAAGSRIADFPRHLGIHCGGIVISPDPLTDHVALQRAAKGLVVTQPDMVPVEKLGLVKIDLLGNRSLGVLPDALAAIQAGEGAAGTTLASQGEWVRRRGGGGRSPPPDKGAGIPDLSDHEALAAEPATRALVREGRTMGCFYIESPAMRNLLRKLRVTDYLGLVAASSIIRPGVAQSGMMQAYVQRRADPSKVIYLHPKMEELLGETLGIMVYQEDVLKIAHAIGGLSLAEADLLRRAMSGKTRSSEAFARMEGRFLASCRRQGIADKVAGEIWRQIESFAGYSFCKAHSASFAKLSYQVAWLKAHHPAEFMGAVLANGGGFYSPAAYVSECRRMGLAVLGPDVNRSRVETTGHSLRGGGTAPTPFLPPATAFATKTPRQRPPPPLGAVQLGLQFVKGIAAVAAAAIVEARAERSFESIEDLAARTPLGWEELDTLVRVGALDSLEKPRTALLWELSRLRRRRSARAGGNGREKGWRLETGDWRKNNPALPLLFESPEAPPPDLPDADEATRIAWEVEILGFPLSRHPLELLAGRIPRDVVPAAEMERHAGRTVRMAGWLIAAKPVVTRDKGERMKILSYEDLTDTFEVVVFPRVYERYASVTLAAGCLAEGRVECEAGVPVLVASRLSPLPAVPGT